MSVTQTFENWCLTGSPTCDILVVGHSHILALQSGSEALTPDSGASFGFLFSEDREKWPQVSDDYWMAISRHPADFVAIVWNGNQHNAHFLLEFEPPLRPAGLERPEHGIDEKSQQVVVSCATFEELWKPDFNELKRVIELLSGDKRCIVVGTPPPKDSSEIRNYLKSDEYFVERARSAGIAVQDLKVTPNEMRVALWKQIQHGMKSVAEETDSVFVEVPDSCLTESQTLAAGMGAPDATHANGIYGASILLAIREKWRLVK